MDPEIPGQDLNPPAPPAPEPERTYTAAEAKALRDEAAANRVKARDAEKRAGDFERRLKDIEDAQKPELQRLTEQAGKLPVLEASLADKDALIQRYEGVFSAQNESLRKALEGQDKSLLALLPEGLTPDQEFAWLAKAQAKAAKDAEGAARRLPPAGGRNPGAGNGKEELTEAQRAALQHHYQTRF